LTVAELGESPDAAFVKTVDWMYSTSASGWRWNRRGSAASMDGNCHVLFAVRTMTAEVDWYVAGVSIDQIAASASTTTTMPAKSHFRRTTNAA
jgi:hypothetical protein